MNALPDGSRPTFSHRLDADPLERQRQREDLGDGLDREGLVAIAGAVDPPFLVGEGDAELVRIDPGERGDVVGDAAAAAMRLDHRQYLGQHLFQGHAPHPVGQTK